MTLFITLFLDFILLFITNSAPAKASEKGKKESHASPLHRPPFQVTPVWTLNHRDCNPSMRLKRVTEQFCL